MGALSVIRIRFRLFRELHHRGALQMVAELYEDGGGLEPEIDAFARHVVGDQEIEIGRMETLLEGMDRR